MRLVRLGWLLVIATVPATVVGACGGAVGASAEPERDRARDAGSHEEPHDAAAGVDDATPSARDSAPASPPPDLSTVPELAACLASTREIHVTRRDADSGTETSYDVDASTSNWIGRSDVGGKAVYVSVAVGSGWMIRMNDSAPLTVGRYQTGSPQPGIFVGANATTFRCAMPTGSFTIEDLARPVAGDSTALDRLAMWFDLVCSDGSRVRGCVRYAR